jgi:hypothetical protein
LFGARHHFDECDNNKAASDEGHLFGHNPALCSPDRINLSLWWHCSMLSTVTIGAATSTRRSMAMVSRLLWIQAKAASEQSQCLGEANFVNPISRL